MSESGLGSPAAVSTPSRLSLFLDRAGLQGFPWVSAIVLYTISWGWILIVRDSYWWDDWSHMLTDTENSYVRWGHAPWFRVFNYAIRAYSPSIMHSVIFLVYFLSALFVFKIIEDLKPRLSFGDILRSRWIVLFFLLIPVNTTRISLNLFQYGFSVTLFFLAWYILVSYRGVGPQILASILFFLSFALPALVAFIVLPLTHYFLQTKLEPAKSQFRRFVLICVLALLPLVFFIARHLYFPNRSSSYRFKPNKIDDGLFLCLFGAVALVVFLLIKPSRIRSILVGVFVGFELCALGLLAYVSTNQIGEKLWFKYPTMIFGRSAWFGRQLILQPLGLSIIIVSIVLFLSRGSLRIERSMMRLLLGVFVFFNLGFGFEYIVDFQKQTQIASAIESAGGDSRSKWIFLDYTTLMNARGREYSPYDWAGLVSTALPTAFNSKTIDNKLIISGEFVSTTCETDLPGGSGELLHNKQSKNNVVVIRGPETHWQALKNWVQDRDMGFKVTVDDTPGACKPEMVTAEKVFGAIPILFYFTGAKN